jgi:hypothetical protein
VQEEPLDKMSNMKKSHFHVINPFKSDSRSSVKKFSVSTEADG